MAMDNDLLEEIMEKCPKKKVISLCKKLIKKCSFKSGACMTHLCCLAYWLYIYDFREYVLLLCEPTHKLVFERDYNVWTFIFCMWGLEIRILKEEGKTKEAREIIDKIDECYLTPLEGSTREKEAEFEKKRRYGGIYSYPECTYKKDIEESGLNSKSFVIECKMSALLRMIGDGSTGLFPKMNEEAENIEKVVQEYLSDLSKVK